MSGFMSKKVLRVASSVRGANTGIISIDTLPKLPMPHTAKFFTPSSVAKKLSSVMPLEAR